MKKSFEITDEIKTSSADGAWHYVNIPADVSAEIDFRYSMDKRGFGSLPVEVTLGKSTWKTSIFPDSKTKTYFLFIKAQVRKAERVAKGDKVKLSIRIRV